MNAELVRAMKREPVKFAHLVGLNLLTDLHNEWIRNMAFGKEDSTTLAHRGSYKTTCLSFALAEIIVLKPRDNSLFLRKTDDDVIEVVKQVGNILRTDVFRYIAYQLYGIELITVDSAFKIDTNLNMSVTGRPQLQGAGIKSSLTGKHADNVITDDIVNVKDRTSKAERDQIKLQYMELKNIVNRGGRILNTGTPWHKDDAISMMPNVKRYDCYQTGLITTEKLHELRESMTDSLFAANYELKHIADKDAMFREPEYEADIEKIFDGEAHIDAAYGGDDRTAYTILHQVEDGFIGYGKIWEKHVDDCMSEIENLHEMYRAGSVACETNADKGYLAKELEERGFYVKTYYEKSNKFIKISTYLKKYWKKIRWIEDTDPEYILMVLDYTENAQHDDAPDSAASLLREMTKNTFSFD